MFVGCFGDPFIEGNELEGGSPAGAYAVLAYLTGRCLSGAVPNQVARRRTPFVWALTQSLVLE